MKRILIFTGDGKGKTTAALGMVLRAAGHRQRVLIIQFIKANTKTGELEACRELEGVEIFQMGKGFSPPKESPRFCEHRLRAHEAIEMAVQAASSGKYHLLVLDEICTAIANGLLEEQEVLNLLQWEKDPCGWKESFCIVLTGRGATPRLMEMADTVTEMKCVRHGYRAGIKAQPGVEY